MCVVAKASVAGSGYSSRPNPNGGICRDMVMLGRSDRIKSQRMTRDKAGK